MRWVWAALLGARHALGWLRFALRWARRSLMLLAIVGLLATNVLAFASSAFISAVSGVASLAGLTTAQARQAATRRAVVDRIGQRTARGAARSLGGTVAQSLPFIGVASVVGITTWELIDACETMEDLAALSPNATDSPETVCGLTPPTAAEVYQEIGDRAGEWSGAAWRWVRRAPPDPAPLFDPAPARR